MEKLIITLMGLFTLFACSEDDYREADKLTESGIVENNLYEGIMPLTVSLGYNSPFQPYPFGTFNVLTTFRNTTPFFLELTPYGEDTHIQTFLAANGIPYPTTSLPLSFPFYPIPSTNFVIPPGATHINQDLGAPLSVNAPPYSNPQGAIMYDFGNWSTNWRMYHYGKIYYFYYKIFDSMGNVVTAGYIKHKFHNDTDDYNDTISFDPNWQFVTDVPNLSAYNVVVMYHTSQFEMCLTNDTGFGNPLPSSVDVTDPVTGTVYTLEFTSDINGIYVNFD